MLIQSGEEPDLDIFKANRSNSSEIEFDITPDGMDCLEWEDEFIADHKPNAHTVDFGDIIDSTLAIALRKPSKVEEAMDFCIERLACTSNHIKNKQKLRYLVNLDHWDFNETTGRHIKVDDGDSTSSYIVMFHMKF
uniref:Uncharacterized protein n=1 Tax=Glossina morsitans morsitans TaxID=37546 RepID=A0A1B0FJ62_GLOMM